MNRSTHITSPSCNSPAVVLRDVSMVSGQVVRLNKISLNIPAGRTALVGRSGAGKSSLLSIIAGFEWATRGSVQQTSTSSQFSMPLFWAPQDNGLWPHLTVRQHLTAVAAPASHGTPRHNASHRNTPHHKTGEQSPVQPPTVESDSHLDKSLAAFDLIHRQAAYPRQLSRGEQNRLAVLRCLLANPAFIVLDEPLIHVDPKRQPQYWNMIEDHLKETGASLIYATHQPEIAVAHSDFCLCLKDGSVDWFGSTDQLYASAPNQQTAEYLGPNNWFSRDEVRIMLGQEHESISCRPEKLRLSTCDTSPLRITRTAFHGSYAMTVVHSAEGDLQKEVIHRPHENVFKVGQSVSLEVL